MNEIVRIHIHMLCPNCGYKYILSFIRPIETDLCPICGKTIPCKPITDEKYD